jgi:hypothetical protein
MTSKLFTVKERQEGKGGRGDNSETDSKAGKFIHNKQKRKWSHNYGKKRRKIVKEVFRINRKKEGESRTDDKRE